MPDRSLDRAIDGLARRQHGVFHRRQAVRIGFTRKMIARREANGRWVRLAGSQVFALPSHPGTWLRQCMAATLSVPASGVGGPSGAALLGFPGWPKAHITVVTRHGTTNRSPFAAVQQSSTIGRLTVVEGIRVVSHADCIVQLAGRLDLGELGALVDDVAITRRSLLPELRERYVAVARSRLPGVGSLREILLERGDGRVPPQDALERQLRTVLESVPGLPAVDWEATPPWLEAEGGRVDALIRDWQLIAEADGRAWHTRVDDFERDRWRDNAALAHGLATVRFSWRQLTYAPAECRNLLVAIGHRRSGSGAPDRAA
jgi:hypothetical protein